MSFKTADVNNVYMKDKKLKKSDVTSLQEWAEKQSHLPQISELQFILFLQSCYYSIESAKNAIDTFFMIKAQSPELFNNRDPCLLQDSMEICAHIISTKATTEGDRIFYTKLWDGTASKYVFNDQIKLFDMTIMSWLTQEGPMNGLIIVMDARLGHMGHLTRINIMTIKKYLYYLQEAMPIRLKSIHIINMAPFVETIISLAKPFMKNELMDMIHFHSSSMETLYEFVPKECLPSHLGGFDESIETLHERAKKRLMDSREFFIQDQLQISDESRRIVKTKSSSELGFEGSFKKLDID